MTSRSRILRLMTRALPVTMVAIFLSAVGVGSANALPLPPCNGGGRIVNVLGTLSLSDCSITLNSTPGPGGGVENYDTMTLTNVVISNNSADSGGGGIYNAGTMTLTNVVVSENTSTGLGGGIENDGGTMFMSNVTVTGNSAGTGGGGIANIGSMIGAAVAVANNTTTTGDGGGILNIATSFCLSTGTDFAICSGPSASPSGGNSLVTGNTAKNGNGGGIANDGGTVTLSDSTVDGNHAVGGGGGGIWNMFATTELVRATISNNTADGNGGGILNDTGAVCCASATNGFATNVTISGNTAHGSGGGVYTTSGLTIFAYATIADNNGVGLYNDDTSFAFTELLATLLARHGTNCVGTINSDGDNLDTGDTCAFGAAGDQKNVGDATVGLGPLAANGGPPQGSSELSAPMMTQALDPTSPAVDAGGATCPATDERDERGVPRPQDGNQDGTKACDIGAFELNPCLTLDKSCSAPLPPYVCTKPITSLTMKWDGTGVSPSTNDCIRIAGTAGSTPFDIDNICVGDVITVSGYDGSQGNDVLWNICQAGSSGTCASGNPAFIAQSSFHLSCSDVDMNSADDCGKIEGDNKGSTSCLPGNNNASCIDRWVFEGMTGPVGSTPLVCEDVSSQMECNVNPQGYVCTKPITSLTMQLSPTSTLSPTTGNCIRIAGSAGANPATPFDIPSICPGQTVRVSGYNGNQGNDVLWNICQANSSGACASGNPVFIGQSSFHLSCSDVDMNSADDCGKLEGNNKGSTACLPGNNNASCINQWIFEGMTGPAGSPSSASLDCANPNGTGPVTYHYVVTNIRSTPVTGILVTDEVTNSSGTTTVPVCGPFDLGPGEQLTCDLDKNIGQLTTNIATASNGECLAVSEQVTVTVNTGATACAAGAANLTVKDKEVRWKLTAPKTQSMEVKEIDITFPASNGPLQEMHLGAPKIFKGSLVSPATISAFTGNAKDRTIDKGHTDELKFMFKNKIATTGYDVTVTFTNGCSVHIAK
jgi:predicted outer membrane repeat protein